VLRPGVLHVIELPWRELRADLHRFVAARVPRSDADDVVQDALTRIHRGIGDVRDHARLGAWIYQVTRSTIVDHHRRARTAVPLEDDDIVTDPAATEDASFAMLARCVTPFVAMLPPVYRQAIALVDLEGVSRVEAAARLGIPISTMKSRVQRGRAQLRELVDACCAIGLDARGHVVEVTPRARPCPAC
jgi:RNA polymerase sigma-70 factor (ECF subfamily)